MTSKQRAYIASEVAVSVVINSVLSLAFALAVSHGVDRLPLWGARGMALDFVPQVFMVTLATTLAVTLLTRKRRRLGRVAALEPASALGLRSPQVALLRALLFAAAAAIVIAPLSMAAMQALSVLTLPTSVFLVFKVVYGALLSVAIAPIAAIAALSDPPPLATRKASS